MKTLITLILFCTAISAQTPKAHATVATEAQQKVIKLALQEYNKAHEETVAAQQREAAAWKVVQSLALSAMADLKLDGTWEAYLEGGELKFRVIKDAKEVKP